MEVMIRIRIRIRIKRRRRRRRRKEEYEDDDKLNWLIFLWSVDSNSGCKMQQEELVRQALILMQH
jgi:hypothetical protein